MVITVSKIKTFVPEFNGNKEQNKEDQISVTIKNPTVAMRDRLIPRPQTKGHASSNGVTDGIDVIIVEPDKKRILTEMVTSIENCAYNDGGVDRAINNVNELLNAPAEFNGLLDEIFDFCQKELQKKVPEKN